MYVCFDKMAALAASVYKAESEFFIKFYSKNKTTLHM